MFSVGLENGKEIKFDKMIDRGEDAIPNGNVEGPLTTYQFS